MAGSNQAGNYSGMFSQIGQALGQSPDITGFVRNIENAGRPDVDLGTTEGLTELTNWQMKRGRAQEAAVTGGLLKNAQTLGSAAAADEAGATWLKQVNEAAQRVQQQSQAGAGAGGISKAVQDYNSVYASAPGNVSSAVRSQAAKITDNVVKPAQAASQDTTVNQMVDSIDNMDKMLQREDITPQQREAILGARERALGQRGVREARTARMENEAKASKSQYEAEERSAIDEGSKAITEAFATGGIKAAAEAAAKHPKADKVFKALKEVHDLKDKLADEVTTLEGNKTLAKGVETAINSLPANIPEATRQGFRTALDTMKGQSEAAPELTQKAMLQLLGSVNTLSTKVTLQAQADSAATARSREEQLTRLETGISDLNDLKVAASTLGITWNQKFNNIRSGSASPNEDYILIDELARDFAKTPEMPRRFKFKDGELQRDPKTGRPLENSNYDADRARWLGAADTTPVTPSDNEAEVNALW